VHGVELTIYVTCRFFVQAIDTPHEWEELRKDVYPVLLKPLVRYLVDETRHEELVCALLSVVISSGRREAEANVAIERSNGTLESWKMAMTEASMRHADWLVNLLRGGL
jgi:hypothetical protein